MAKHNDARKNSGVNDRAESQADLSHVSGSVKIQAESVGGAAGAQIVASAALTDATPSMAQYLEIKAANPDSLLWYRMGDFYELFFEDAVAASQALSIVLTKRGRHQGLDIPMCGVPVHRADDYLQRLIRKGFRVAVCEQLEDPAEARKRGAKAVVRRDVVRLVTPGTITEETLLDATARNFLTAFYLETPAEAGPLAAEARVALASIDISTGEFEIGSFSGADIVGELVRLASGEVLLTDQVFGDSALRKWIETAGGAATPIAAAYFDASAGSRDLKVQLGVAALDGFGDLTRGELAAVGALLKYIDLTQLGRKPVLRVPKRSGNAATLMIDAATRASLELVRSVSGDASTSLFAAINRTVTAAGARTLKSVLSTPLTNADAINRRLDAVAFFAERRQLASAARAALRAAPDLQRALPRLAFGRGGPRDLAAVRDALSAADACRSALSSADTGLGLPDMLSSLIVDLSAVAGHSAGHDLLAKLTHALADDLPLTRRDGGFIRSGYASELDGARSLRDDTRVVIAELEQRYIAETGIKALKIRHNNILGYFIEVTQINAKPLLSEPLSQSFKHRQTMANAVRFATAELMELEGRAAAASERAANLEQEIFASLAADIAASDAPLAHLAGGLADLDVLSSLAAVAIEQNFVRPVVDGTLTFEIIGGRHPVVEQALAGQKTGTFIENDCVLGRAGPAAAPGFDEAGEARIWLVTGPNMAGKSTFLRQNALIAVLAQMGSFVPARSAHIGIIDRLFSRVGASDDLARGRSTFMVEMVETAAILNQATERSLVILDEIGRGTATFDGLSIAWATVEYLHEVTKARALFATHYHELTALVRKLKSIANVTMDVTDYHDDIVFLHKVKPGAADRSYGIQVAKLAGLPQPVVERARDVLAQLEKSDRQSGPKKSRAGNAAGSDLDDLPLFSAQRPQSNSAAVRRSALELALAAIRVDELSPRAALDKLYELQTLAAQKKPTDT